MWTPSAFELYLLAGIFAVAYLSIQYWRGSSHSLDVSVAEMSQGGICWRAGLLGGIAAAAVDTTVGVAFLWSTGIDGSVVAERYKGVHPIVIFLFWVYLAPIAEEFLYRGYFQPRAARYLNSRWLGLIAVNVVFTLIHFGGGLRQMVIIFLPGLIFGWLRDAYNSVWPAVIAHAVCNACIFVLLSVIYGWH